MTSSQNTTVEVVTWITALFLHAGAFPKECAASPLAMIHSHGEMILH